MKRYIGMDWTSPGIVDASEASIEPVGVAVEVAERSPTIGLCKRAVYAVRVE